MANEVTVIIASSKDANGVATEHAWSSVAYRDPPGGAYANRQFLPVIDESLSVVIGTDSILNPLAESTVTGLELINQNGALDHLSEHTWGGYVFRMYSGTTDQAFASLTLQRTGVFSRLNSITKEYVRFDVRDSLSRFNEPLSTSTYPPGEINAGEAVPMYYGRIGFIRPDALIDTTVETTYYQARTVTYRIAKWDQNITQSGIPDAWSGGKKVHHPVYDGTAVTSALAPRANIRGFPTTDNRFYYTQYLYNIEETAVNFFYRIRYDNITGLAPVVFSSTANILATYTQGSTASQCYIVASGLDYNGQNTNSLVIFVRTGLVPLDGTVVTHPDGTFQIDGTPNADQGIIYNKDILSQEFRVKEYGETSDRSYYDILNPQTGNAFHRPGDIIHMMLSVHKTDADIQTPNLEQLNTELPHDSGVYLKNNEGAIDGIRELMSGGYQLSTTNDANAKFRIFVLEEPAVSPSFEIDRHIVDVDGIEIHSVHAAVWRIRVHCTRNTAPISQSFDTGDFRKSPAMSSEFMRQARSHEWTGEAVITGGKAHAEQEELEFECGLYDEDGSVALAEAQRLLALYGVDRTVYKIPLNTAYFGVAPGDSVTVKYPRYGLDAGVSCRVLKVRDFPLQNRSEILVWR